MSLPQFVFGKCAQCAEPYRLPAEAAGKKARCKACDAVFVVGAGGEPEPAGKSDPSPIIQHAERRREFEFAGGDSETIQAIDAHIQEHIGPVESVFHELISDLVHIDIHWVRPEAGRPWHTLITSGMSDRPMNAPPGAEHCRYAELMVCLPPEWRMTHEDFKDERWYWPLRWLKMLARLPHEYETWLWCGHSVPNGDPPRPIASNTRFCGVVLGVPITPPAEFCTLTVGDRRIAFLSMLPLYAEEMAHKIQHGFDVLIPRFEKHGINEVLNLTRPNVCRRKVFGIW